MKVIIAGTGHRPDKLGGYSEQVLRKLINTIKPNLLGADQVISGMALGYDTALAIAALELDINLLCAVPFLGQESKWPKESQERYKEILQEAHTVIYVGEPGYAVWKMQTRNEWMVDHCTKLLCLWNGSNGGTANCIRYALAKNVKIENIWDQYEAFN